MLTMIEAADVERAALARDLHDTFGQQITGVRMMLAALVNDVAQRRPRTREDLLDRLNKLQLYLKQMHKQIRSITNGLSPVEIKEGGLPAALDHLADETTELYAVTCRFECVQEVPRMDHFTAMQLLLIAREATHNAAKHAHADEIVICLLAGSDICLIVEDNGIGLPTDAPPQSSGIGLRSMRDRAALINADFHFESPPEGGTIVSCAVPGPPR